MFWSKTKTANNQVQEAPSVGLLAVREQIDAGAEQIMTAADAWAVQHGWIREQDTSRAKQEEAAANALLQKCRADASVEDLKEQLGMLYALLDLTEADLAEAMIGGKNQRKYMKEKLSLEKQISRTEDKLRVARYNQWLMQRRLSAI